MVATLNGKRGLQIVLPNTPGIQGPVLCKENSGPNDGVRLNSRPERRGVWWGNPGVKTQASGGHRASKLGKMQKKDTDTLSRLPRTLYLSVPAAHLPYSSFGEHNRPLVPQERQARTQPAPSSFTCLQWAGSLPTRVTLLDVKELCCRY